MRIVDSRTLETDVMTPSARDSVLSNVGPSTASTMLALFKLAGSLTARVTWASRGPSQSMDTSSCKRPGIVPRSALMASSSRVAVPSRRRRTAVAKCS